MIDNPVFFDDMRPRVVEALRKAEIPDVDIYLVRNLYGMLRISVSEEFEHNQACLKAVNRLADQLSAALGTHGHPPGRRSLFVSDHLLKDLAKTAQPIEGFSNVFWEDRLITGEDWWTISEPRANGRARRWTLYSIKGGVGRSTTAAVLARHLAGRGQRVLVVDLDLESPGLSSAMLDPSAQPKYGIADWFVEELVGQDNLLIEELTAEPTWAQELAGAVAVAPAHGREPGEYLAKLGRVYMQRADAPWIVRLERLLTGLEARFDPDFVLIESRSGLHDIAAATVTDLGADILLFATDSENCWTDYEILFDHWRDRNLATKIRERLSIVSALTPELETERYLQGFKQRAWDLFRDRLYDDLGTHNASSSVPNASDEEFSFDLNDEDAPHDPIAVHWTRGLAAGTSLRDLERTAVWQAYAEFLGRFDRLVEINDRESDR